MTNNIGFCEGDECGRNGCNGVIKEHPVENCSCHINPPCSACTAPRGFCPTCEWEESEDEIIPSNYNFPYVPYKVKTINDLDKTKMDWISKSHTHFSMIKEGVYPPGASMSDVKKVVDGTFGGRFDYFSDGKFKFVAYTD